MKTAYVWFLAAALALLAGCVSRKEIRSGDLIFVGIPGDYSLDEDSMDSTIGASTGDGTLNWIHVGIIEVLEDGPYVIDATIRRGVDRHPLDTFICDFTLRDGSLPVFEVKRLRKDASAAGCARASEAFLGLPYDVHFLPDNGEFYCSELVQASYLDGAGEPLFPSEPMNFKNAEGEMPVYWEQLFALLGEKVPQDTPGTSPRSLYESPLLRSVPVVFKN